MSKKRRTFKAKTIALSEASPVAGAISPEKDTLFIKQVESNYAKLYASDSKGKTLGIVGDVDIQGLSKKQIVALKNRIENEDYSILKVNSQEDLVFYHEGERMVYPKHYRQMYLESNEISFKSHEYPDVYMMVNGKIFGKDLPDIEHTISANSPIYASVYTGEISKETIKVTNTSIKVTIPWQEEVLVSANTPTEVYVYDGKIKIPFELQNQFGRMKVVVKNDAGVIVYDKEHPHTERVVELNYLPVFSVEFTELEEYYPE